ncbi:MAG TPA: ATP-binding protein [Blastocatellia bacterium]|nr:ATP-binding protein [Blastocatellia bacterium]
MSFSSDSSPHPSILSQLAGDEILPRTAAALDDIYQAAVLKNARAVLVIGRPQTGKTELLRLTYDRLFQEQGRTLPIYFSLRRDRLSPDKFTKDFLLTLLRQYLAFVNHDPALVPRHEMTERDLMALASAQEYAALKEILDSYESRAQDPDKRSLVRYALGLPQRLAARSPYHIVVLLDEAQWLDRIVTDEEIATLFGEVLQQPHLVSFILTGQQRALLDQLAAEEGVIGNVKLLHFLSPDLPSLQDLVKKWCDEDSIPFDSDIGRLAVHQMDGNLFYLRALTAASSERKLWFDKGADFERLYVSELLQGRIAHYFSRLLRQIASDAARGQSGEHAAIEIVYICAEAMASRAPVELIKSRLSARIEVSALLAELHRQELLTLLDGHILPSEDPVFCDWIAATHKRFEGASLEEVKLDLLRRRIKSVPQMLSLSARRTLHTQIEAMLRRFDGQSMAHSLFAHDEFVIRYGHATYEIMLAGLAAEIERVQLPQIVHVAEGHLFTHRSLPASWSYLLAFGFEQGIYDQEHEIVWLLAVADSPSAVTAEAVQSLDQHLNEIQTALTANQSQGKPTPNIMRWAISKMGFTPDGTIALLERGFAASDSLQLELLTRGLNSNQKGETRDAITVDVFSAPLEIPSEVTSPLSVPLHNESPSEKPLGEVSVAETSTPPRADKEAVDANHFEMAIPINDDKEIIAARVAERLARNAGFAPEAVNQIKTALIEACLSLAAVEETSAGKIYQRYLLDEEKLVITVSNTATGLDDTTGTLVVEDPERLWRLDVLRSLVDFVRLTKLGVGWRVELTRFIPPRKDT